MKRICKIVTCGDVDSGKSTLLGRLLYNTNNIYDDQLADLRKASDKYSLCNRLEYGLLFDGLLEERKQQITIDIAHRFFNIKDTRFHLLDCPGHAQYTHNFVIAAAEADVAILVIDATKGLMPQTLVHLEICKLFKIQKIILAITKIDLINENIIHNLKNNIKKSITDINYDIFATSAIENININSLGDFLYKTSLEINEETEKFALCVQSVKKLENKRIYQGISFGNYDIKQVKIYPSEIKCQIKKEKNGVDIYSLDKDIDISRGYIITNLQMKYSATLIGKFINFNIDSSLQNLLFKYGTSLHKVKSLNENTLILDEAVYFCNIEEFKHLGYGIFIDEKTKLNAGIFILSNNKSLTVKHCYWFTGYSGSGKTTLANKLASYFALKPVILDGDEIRNTINYDLTLSDKDRDKNVKKIANLAKMLIEQGFNVIVACISKDLRQRFYAKNLLKDSYVEIFVDASEETRKQRDTKNLYKNNIQPLANYEYSNWNYITIKTDEKTIDEATAELIQKLQQNNYI